MYVGEQARYTSIKGPFCQQYFPHSWQKFWLSSLVLGNGKNWLPYFKICSEESRNQRKKDKIYGEFLDIKTIYYNLMMKKTNPIHIILMMLLMSHTHPTNWNLEEKKRSKTVANWILIISRTCLVADSNHQK